MGKYHVINEKDKPYINAELLMQEAIANELAEVNRLKRLELRYKILGEAPRESEFDDWEGEAVVE